MPIRLQPVEVTAQQAEQEHAGEAEQREAEHVHLVVHRAGREDQAWARMRSLKNPGVGGRRLEARPPVLRDREPRSSRLASWRAPGVPVPARRPSCQGRIRQGPSRYEMEGPCPASPRQANRLPGFAGTARRPPGSGTRARDRSPGSSHVLGVAPRWCPFPTVKAFLLSPPVRAQGPAAN